MYYAGYRRGRRPLLTIEHAWSRGGGQTCADIDSWLSKMTPRFRAASRTWTHDTSSCGWCPALVTGPESRLHGRRGWDRPSGGALRHSPASYADI